MSRKVAQGLAARIGRLQIYRDYEGAFSESTRLPLEFQPAGLWRQTARGTKYQNPFCALLATAGDGCAMCWDTRRRAARPGASRTKTVVCFAGLCDSAVPVRLGDEVIGFLKTGQVALRRPTRTEFKRVARQLVKWGVKTDLKRLEEAYFHTTVLSKRQYAAMLRLLEVFAQHLATAAERMALHDHVAESPMIARAKEFIDARTEERIKLRDVARFVNTSTFYFCKMFKRATGLTFTAYLSLVRIAKAKNLLMNPNLRVSEIAFQVGFDSLTHFNRVFRRLVGKSPTAYRHGLPTPV